MVLWVRMAGWVCSVSFSCSSGPWAISAERGKPRASSASWSTAWAAGSAAARSTPMPTAWEPWPGNNHATLLIGEPLDMEKTAVGRLFG